MNFNQRVASIRFNLIKADAKRTMLLVKIPVLRKNVSALKRELELIEAEMDLIDDTYARRNSRDHEWQLLIDVLEELAWKTDDALSDAENELEDAEYCLDEIEGGVEGAYYDSVDAVRS